MKKQSIYKLVNIMIFIACSALVFAACNKVESVIEDNIEQTEDSEIASASLDGSYQLQGSSIAEDTGAEETQIMTFHESISTYETTKKTGEETFTIDSGTFSQEGDLIQTYSEASDEYSLVYREQGDYLFQEDDSYKGSIPDENSFSQSVTYETQGMSDKITFYENGTYEREFQNADNPVTETQGTYQRIDTSIMLYDETGEEVEAYYIYNHELIRNFYKKITDRTT